MLMSQGVRPRALPRVSAFWAGLSLSAKFLIVSSLAIVTAMAIVGAWLSSRIESAVSQYSALDAALYVEAVVGDRIQGLGTNPTFDPSVQEELEKLVLQTPLGRRILSFKVWLENGHVVYASTPKHAGQTYTPTDNLKQAWRGTIVFEFNQLNDKEDEIERSLDVPLLEIYVPVRKRFGGDVVAVVEFYEDATPLVGEMARSKRQSWMLLAALGVGVVGALYGMARRASQTIDRQQSALNDRIGDLSRLLAQNLALRQRIEASSRRAVVLNERYLRRIGSELHDGPAQLISLAMLRLDTLRNGHATALRAGEGASEITDERGRVREVLEEALKEIRELSAGLSVPELDRSTLSSTIADAVRVHRQRSATSIRVDVGTLPALEGDRETRLTVYRFLQEGLNNACRHAPGAQVRVKASANGAGLLTVEIADDGPGFDPATIEATDRLGIAGMRERLESLGGSLEIAAGSGRGTILKARLPISDGGEHD